MEKGIKAIHKITTDFSNPTSPINNLLQKLPDWLSNNLRPLIYKLSIENKVIELDKSYAKEHILEALEELLPKSILRKEVAKQLDSAKVILFQVIPLTPAISVIASSLISLIIAYPILILFLIVVI
ncbi:28423_t:CDS:2 [Gigaspora margarita]|uniref:28423_t:CDS:1 n=1 Tax=Gigaspora margarita TaxID=4874 RepID=A0ABN7ULC3_GIGMA|nr:28423_t:CDS:2 [Gigaspora margarita]